MSVASWEVAFSLSTPVGTLNLNTLVALPSASTGIYLLNPDGCKAEIPLRSTDDAIPQADGEQMHERFFAGYTMTLSVQLWQSYDVPACDELLQEMLDELMLHVRAFANPTDGRVYWQPAGAAQRMIRKVQLNSSADITLASGLTQIDFQLKSPYPYAWTAAENPPTSLDATLTNGGTADFWPVIKVYGPATQFTITNTDVVDDFGVPLQIVYDSSRPGAQAIPGGSYAEIDTFRNTIYLNGDQDNLKPGLDIAVSDFFPIAVGDNAITLVGGAASATVLWQDAWG